MLKTTIPLQFVRWEYRGLLALFLLAGFPSYILRCQGQPGVADAASAEQLIGQLSCQSNLDEAQRAKIRDELSRRRPTRLLIGAYANGDECQKRWIVQALYSIRAPRERAVNDFMRSLVSAKTDEETWFALEYMAQQGDKKALAQLTQNCYRYEIPSFAWGDTLLFFGKYKYHPAVPCLIGSIGSAAGEQALQALRMLFPGSPARFRTDQEAREYFQRCEKKKSTPDALK